MFKILGLLGLAVAVWWLRGSASEPQQATTIALEAQTSIPLVNASSKIDENEESRDESQSLITDFTAPAEADRWWSVNDTVMGGVSQSELSVTPEGIGIFSGNLSLENNGGFSSIRRDIAGNQLSDATEISLRVKGDGRPYQLRLKMSSSDRAPSYRVEFETQNGEWLTVTLPFSEFVPVFRGRIVEDAPILALEEVVEIGLLLSDGQSGEFKLEVDWMRVE